MPCLLAIHSDIISKTIYDKGEAFGPQNNAIWLVHGNVFRIMILLFFRLMTIDMTLFQFIDWFLEQFEDDESCPAGGASGSEDELQLEKDHGQNQEQKSEDQQ